MDADSDADADADTDAEFALLLLWKAAITLSRSLAYVESPSSRRDPVLLSPWLAVRLLVSVRKARRRLAFRERLRKSLEEKSTFWIWVFVSVFGGCRGVCGVD